ncbi:ZIP family metal transporter [Pseudalkalibacillus caeni]|uniref:ZIP family metal transporter n=1 Tax=Exobacillus caeni TaxID=2574798 RepID=A0A5R9EZ21_9BACL|nr:ZIP family metal transporter [Pseudalkalibacillus caeni]TLS36552.1 ZIP family metal transporter [Pseudalkalibacillus caeni]
MAFALIGSFISAMATVLGAVPLMFVNGLSLKWKDILIAFTAGIMVSASIFGLIPQALSEANIVSLSIGLLIGIIVLDVMEKNIPHINIEDNEGTPNFDAKSILVIAALILHNIPEGMSTGFSFASENAKLGPIVSVAIGAQNIPEGLILAVFLLNSKTTKAKAFFIVFLTGLVEVVSAFIGYAAASYISWVISYGLAFAAGAMLFIVYKELIPESHGNGYERVSTYSFIIGLLLMIYISHFLG